MTLERVKNIALIALTIIVVCLWLFRGCGKSVTPIPVNTKLGSDIKQEIKFKDSLRIKDSITIHWIDNYRADKKNPKKLPCDTFLKVIVADCDTVIIHDSIEKIASKNVIKQDSVVQKDYSDQHTKDSTTIIKLEKKVKRNKFFTKVAFITGLGIGGYAGFKLH